MPVAFRKTGNIARECAKVEERSTTILKKLMGDQVSQADQCCNGLLNGSFHLQYIFIGE